MTFFIKVETRDYIHVSISLFLELFILLAELFDLSCVYSDSQGRAFLTLLAFLALFLFFLFLSFLKRLIGVLET